MPTANPSCRLADHRRCLVLLQLSSIESSIAENEHRFKNICKIIERRRRDPATGACLWPKVLTEFSHENEEWSRFQGHRKLRAVLLTSSTSVPNGDLLTIKLPDDFQSDNFEALLDDLMNKLVSNLAARLNSELSSLEAANSVSNSPSTSAASTPSTPPTDNASLNSSMPSSISLSLTGVSGGVNLPWAPIEATEIAGWSDGKRTKRAIARREKQKADLRLLLGDLKAAKSGFKAASESLRALNDFLWYAAALEGLSAVAVADSSHLEADDVASNFSDSSTVLEAPEAIACRCREASNEYLKYSGATWLAAEASIKSVRAMRGSRLHRQRSRWSAVEAIQFLELPATEKLLTSCIRDTWCLGDLMAELGLTRRAALHRWLAARRLVGDDQITDDGEVDDEAGGFGDVDSAVVLLSRCLDDFNAGLTSPRLRVLVSIRLVSLLRRKRWRRNNSARPSDEAWRRALATLGNLGPWLTVDECRSLFDCLADVANSLKEPIEAPSKLPEWLSAKPEPMTDSPIRMTARLTDQNSTSAGESGIVGTNNKPLFIYTPLTLDTNVGSSGKTATVYWSIEEANRLQLTVRHNLPVGLQLWKPSLLVRHVQQTATTSLWPAKFDTKDNAESLALPPNVSSMDVNLLVSPEMIGRFELVGIDYRLDSGLPLRCRFPTDCAAKFVPYIRVAPAMPKLRLEWLDNPNGVKGDTVRLIIDPSILSGRPVDQSQSATIGNSSASMQLRLTNASNLSISRTSLDLMPLGLASWSETNLARQLPIAPGGVAAVTLYVGIGSGREMPDFGRHRLRVRVRYCAVNESSEDDDNENKSATSLGREAVLYGHVIVARANVAPTAGNHIDEDSIASTEDDSGTHGPGVDDEEAADAVATGDWLASQLNWACSCDGVGTNGSSGSDHRGLSLVTGQVRAVSVEVRYRGDRILRGPVLLVWPEQAGLLVTGQTATQLPELSRQHRVARLSSGVLLLGNASGRQLVATLFFPSTNVKVTKAWPILAD